MTPGKCALYFLFTAYILFTNFIEGGVSFEDAMTLLPTFALVTFLVALTESPWMQGLPSCQS
jgi:hypothetical protein